MREELVPVRKTVHLFCVGRLYCVEACSFLIQGMCYCNTGHQFRNLILPRLGIVVIWIFPYISVGEEKEYARHSSWKRNIPSPDLFMILEKKNSELKVLSCDKWAVPDRYLARKISCLFWYPVSGQISGLLDTGYPVAVNKKM